MHGLVVHRSAVVASRLFAPVVGRASSISLPSSFVYRRCLHAQAPLLPHSSSFKAVRQTPFLAAFRAARSRSTRSAPRVAPSPSEKGAASTITSQSPKKTETRFFPETNSKSVGYWLLGSAASVFGIVIFGGLTRMTESGLSITEWRPITGSLPPTTLEQWESEFALYRASPEFKQLNSRMTLEEFKQIYWMEWIHRLWGRVVGLTFLVPTVYFIATRRVTPRMAVKLTAICGLIGFQGFIGWWMVKSGLKDDLFAPGSHPRVSQYRLTAHLGTAFICYLAMFWNGLSILQENSMLREAVKGELWCMPRKDQLMRRLAMQPFRRSVAALAVLVFITAMSGGLVAGLDAGLIYNEFPYMGLGLTPPSKELWDPFYSHVPDHSDLWWRNMLENPSLVQLDHRIMATTTFTAVMALWAYTRFSPNLRRYLPAPAKKAMAGVVALAWMQVVLGISTLIYLVPLPVASAHQAGALALLSGTLFLGSRVWVPRRFLKLAFRQIRRNRAANKAKGLEQANATGSRYDGHGRLIRKYDSKEGIED